MYKNNKISVVVPAYNEEKLISKTIKNVPDFVDKIIVIDDASKDKTGEIIDKLAKENPKIRVFHNKRNMNLGYSYKMGIKHSTKKYLILLHGLDSTNLDSIKTFITGIREKIVISGYIKNKEARPLYRKIISYLVTKVRIKHLYSYYLLLIISIY
ncbi:MAG: glycosyltransferase family 2 protein [Bacteroidetes bacterium]|nr:glycosyltransferase family 2 protein [Bacteroidota bacterium]